jgi:multimeric flavodoxin WrbA
MIKKFTDTYPEEDKLTQDDTIKVVMLNCSLKKNETSNTEALLKEIQTLYQEKFNDVETDIVRVADYEIEPGISHEKINERDEFDLIYEKMKNSDIIIIGTALWFGERTSITQRILERMIGSYGDYNSLNQYSLYGKVGAVVVTGNEDGAHSASGETLYNLARLGCLIPPNPNSYWVGDAGPGPSYIESNGTENFYTNKSMLYLVHNTYHYIKLIKQYPYRQDLKALDKEAEEMVEKKKKNRRSSVSGK